MTMRVQPQAVANMSIKMYNRDTHEEGKIRTCNLNQACVVEVERTHRHTNIYDIKSMRFGQYIVQRNSTTNLSNKVRGDSTPQIFKNNQERKSSSGEEDLQSASLHKPRGPANHTRPFVENHFRSCVLRWKW